MYAKKKIFEALDKHFEFYNQDIKLRREAKEVIKQIAANARKAESYSEKLDALLVKYIDEREDVDENFDPSDLYEVSEAIFEKGFPVVEEFDPDDPIGQPVKLHPVDLSRAKEKIWRYVLGKG